MAELIGRALDRYEILSLLGAGGMGSVYRARDAELGRHVAIKVLRDLACEDPQRLERFNREIRTVARLSHPNLVKIHDFGHAEGVSYAVMELLRGSNLRERMRGRPMRVEQALDIGVAIANGLGAAHHQGVLHRDIKPENIFITSSGDVKILDFGLARTVGSVDPDGETQTIEPPLTAIGTVLGTSGYMSPEQVRGRSLDVRSDIFSLGCVLYEMLSGSNPFRKGTRADTTSAILNFHPPPLTELRPTLPPVLDLIVGRCLNKDPSDRFESARDVAFAMQALSDSRSGFQPVSKEVVSVKRRALRWAVAMVVTLVALMAGVLGIIRMLPPDLPQPERVAVMRFVSEEDDQVLDELGAGLTQVVASGLRRLEQTSDRLAWTLPRLPLRYLEQENLPETSRMYNVNVAVLGRLDRHPSELKLTLSAIDPATERRIGSTVIRDTLGNPGSFQGRPIAAAAELLGIDVDDQARDAIEADSTDVIGALEAFLRGTGRSLLAVGDDDVFSAIDELSRATSLDPQFESARIELGRACLSAFQRTDDPTWLSRGVASLAPLESAESYRCLADLRLAQGKPESAIEALHRAVALEPLSGEAHLRLGRALDRTGLIDGAARELRQSMYCRPGYWPANHWLARLYESQGQFQAAAIEFRRVVDAAPAYSGGYNNLGVVYLHLGETSLAREMFEQSLAIDSKTNYAAYSNLGQIAFSDSRFSDAATMFEKALAIGDTDYRVWGNLGFAYAWGTTPEKAHRPLERAISLATAALGNSQSDPQILVDISGYHAILGHQAEGLAAVRKAMSIDPLPPLVIADIAGSLEILGERDLALEWIGRALSAGVSPGHFDAQPPLKGLRNDPRFRAIVAQHDDHVGNGG